MKKLSFILSVVSIATICQGAGGLVNGTLSGGGSGNQLPAGVVTNTPYPIPFVLYTNGYPLSIYLSNGPTADTYVNGAYNLKFTTDSNNVVYTNIGNSVDCLVYTNDYNQGPGFIVISNATYDVYDNQGDMFQLNGGIWVYGYGSPLNGTSIPAMTGGTNYNGTNFPKLVVADYFQGSGNLLTGYPAASYGAFTNNVVVTCSARGIANGLSVLTNDGAMFGPDTTGTTTCGLREAFAKNMCGLVVLSSGVFDLNGSVVNAYRCHVIGAGQFNTNSSNLGTVIRCHVNIQGSSCHFEHCTFAGDNNGITYLTVGEGNPLSYGEGIVEYCYFAPWGFLTNVLSLGIGASINPINDTGLQLGYSYGSDFAIGNNFDYLALGIMITGDHGMVIGNQFLDNLSATNAYSTTNLLSQCPSIAISYQNGERQDYTFQHNVFVNQHAGYAVINNGNAGLYNGLYVQKWTSYDDNFEGVGIPCLLATNANVRWVFESPNQFLATASTNSYFSPPGSWNGRIVTNLMTIVNPEESGDPKVFGNWLVTGTNSAGYFSGNGSGLTNLPPMLTTVTIPLGNAFTAGRIYLNALGTSSTSFYKSCELADPQQTVITNLALVEQCFAGVNVGVNTNFYATVATNGIENWGAYQAAAQGYSASTVTTNAAGSFTIPANVSGTNLVSLVLSNNYTTSGGGSSIFATLRYQYYHQ